MTLEHPGPLQHFSSQGTTPLTPHGKKRPILEKGLVILLSLVLTADAATRTLSAEGGQNQGDLGQGETD
jgi:hypothetical protein